MNENNIVTYSFMSALLSGGGDIYTYVYLPLVKRAITTEATDGKKNVSVDDLIYSIINVLLSSHLITYKNRFFLLISYLKYTYISTK